MTTTTTFSRGFLRIEFVGMRDDTRGDATYIVPKSAWTHGLNEYHCVVSEAQKDRIDLLYAKGYKVLGGAYSFRFYTGGDPKQCPCDQCTASR